MSKSLDQVILQLYARTPAPCRDYCGLTITNENVILNVWNITYGPHVYPKRFKCALENLKQNKFIQSEINRVFGNHVVDYAKSLASNELKLENLSTKAFLSVLKYVAAKDILTLSQTSKILFERCNDDKIWSLMFRKLFKKSPTRQNLQEVQETGWKKLILDKILALPKNFVSKSKYSTDSQTVNNMKNEKKLIKCLIKSETNLILQRKNQTKRTSNCNLRSITETPRTFIQVKSERLLDHSNSKTTSTKTDVKKIKNDILPINTTLRKIDKNIMDKTSLDKKIKNLPKDKKILKCFAPEKSKTKSAEKKNDNVKSVIKNMVKSKQISKKC